MIRKIGIVSPGDMGHTVGQVLINNGLEVFTCLAERSQRTRQLAEKVGITVERCPFIIIGMGVSQQNGVQVIRFHTSTDEQIIADSEHHLAVEEHGGDDFPLPVIHVRDGLTGLLSRAVFYRLAEIAVEHEVKEAPRLGVFSSGIFFPLD